MNLNESPKNLLYELASNFLLEAAVLVFVLGFLEKVISNIPISLTYGISISGLSLAGFMIGFYLKVLEIR